MKGARQSLTWACPTSLWAAGQIGAAHFGRDSQTCAPVASESSPDGLLISASARASSASTSSWTPDLPSSVLSSGMGCESSEASPGSASSDPGDINSGTDRIVPLVDGTMLRTAAAVVEHLPGGAIAGFDHRTGSGRSHAATRRRPATRLSLQRPGVVLGAGAVNDRPDGASGVKVVRHGAIASCSSAGGFYPQPGADPPVRR